MSNRRRFHRKRGLFFEEYLFKRQKISSIDFYLLVCFCYCLACVSVRVFSVVCDDQSVFLHFFLSLSWSEHTNRSYHGCARMWLCVQTKSALEKCICQLRLITHTHTHTQFELNHFAFYSRFIFLPQMCPLSAHTCSRLVRKSNAMNLLINKKCVTISL